MKDFSLKNNRCIICAKTNSGKSYLLKYILNKEKHKFHKIYCISPTEFITHFYYPDIVTNENHIFAEFSDEWLGSLIKKLTNYKKQNDKPYNVLLILDDVGHDCHQSKNLNNVFVRGRHINISIVMCLQFLHQAPLTCRTNASYILVGQQNKASTEMLCDEFFSGGNINKDQFLKMYQASPKACVEEVCSFKPKTLKR